MRIPVLMSAAALMWHWRPLTLVVALAACSGGSSDHVARAKSPNGRLEAILTETNGGATTSFGYEVSLETSPGGGDLVRVAKLYGATRNEQAYGANLVWLDNHTLEVQYLNAKSAIVERASLLQNGQTVMVHLRAGILDKTAPPGGMEYNLHRR